MTGSTLTRKHHISRSTNFRWETSFLFAFFVIVYFIFSILSISIFFKYFLSTKQNLALKQNGNVDKNSLSCLTINKIM